eukprot:scaffold112219_cov27-Tisochrysis_lutea.AAC.4
MPLRYLPLHAKLRQEDLHSKEFFQKLKQQKWGGNIKEIYKTSDWHNNRGVERGGGSCPPMGELSKNLVPEPLSRARGDGPQGRWRG